MTIALYERFGINSTRTGDKIHKLTIKGATFYVREGKAGKHRRHAVFECECGNRIVLIVKNVENGTTKSCKCIRNTQGGLSIRFVGEYNSWKWMIDRCENKDSPAYADYGGSGIIVCDRWHDFKNFFRDVGQRPSSSHTIDRFPNNRGNYEPGNVRWATREEQVNNRTNTAWLEIDGIRRCIGDWSRIGGIKTNTLHGRLKHGWIPKTAVFLPLKSKTKSFNQPPTPAE